MSITGGTWLPYSKQGRSPRTAHGRGTDGHIHCCCTTKCVAHTSSGMQMTLANTEVPSRRIPRQYIRATNGHLKFAYSLLHLQLYVRNQQIAANRELHLNCSCSSKAIQALRSHHSVFTALSHNPYRGHMAAILGARGKPKYRSWPRC